MAIGVSTKGSASDKRRVRFTQPQPEKHSLSFRSVGSDTILWLSFADLFLC